MGKEKNRCLYCGEETEGWFCQGGGTTLDRSNTGEGFQTKSFCYSDFLTILKITEAAEVEAFESDKYYKLWEGQIKEWYKSIVFVEGFPHTRHIEAENGEC